MDRAEKESLLAYPENRVRTIYGGNACLDTDAEKEGRRKYAEGYRKASKDAVKWVKENLMYSDNVSEYMIRKFRKFMTEAK